jgi:hypothetical protein
LHYHCAVRTWSRGEVSSSLAPTFTRAYSPFHVELRGTQGNALISRQSLRNTHCAWEIQVHGEWFYFIATISPSRQSPGLPQTCPLQPPPSHSHQKIYKFTQQHATHLLQAKCGGDLEVMYQIRFGITNRCDDTRRRALRRRLC